MTNTQQPAPRSYVVGLPVVIHVLPGGRVEFEVDLSEADDARLLSEGVSPGQDDRPETVDSDACQITEALRAGLFSLRA